MCILNEDSHVEDTKILVAINSDRSRQFTIYCNEVQAQSPNNMMILPVPLGPTGIAGISFVDLSSTPELFNELRNWYVEKMYGHKFYYDLSGGGDFLPVTTVGSYRVTLVPSLEGFGRLDRNVFGQITNGVRGFLAGHYLSPHWAFIVCKIEVGSQKYHPFGYVHETIEGKTAFVPTRHYHSAWEVGPPHWDHTIYYLNFGKGISTSGGVSGGGIVKGDGDLHKIFAKALRRDASLAPFLSGVTTVESQRISGRYDNRDILVTV